jgi:internalin A
MEVIMNQKTKKTLTIAGVALGAAVILVVAALLFRSCTKDSRFDGNYEAAQQSYLAGDYDKAIQSLEKAMDVDDRDACYLLLADIYAADGQLDKAIDILNLASYNRDSAAIAQKLEELKAQQGGTQPAGDTILVGGQEISTEATTLLLSDKGLTDISAVAQLKLLESVSLQNNAISDLSPLSGLTGLTFLNLSNNQITDVSALSGLTALRTLYLDGNAIADFAPLQKLSSLTTLSLKDVEITESQLEELETALPKCGIYTSGATDEAEELTLGGETFMSDVTELNLDGKNITDISVLAKCTQLTKLDLRNNKITDLTPLMELQDLTWLCLWNNEVEDLRPLMGLTRLTYLDADGNKIRDITPLEFLPDLKEVFLSHNDLVTISPLKGLTGLTRLGLKDVGLEDADLDTLMGVKTLRELAVDENDGLSAEKLDALKETLKDCTVTHSEAYYSVKLGGKTFRSNAESIDAQNAGVTGLAGLEKFTKLKNLHLSGNQITDISPLKDLKDLEVVELRLSNVPNATGISDISALSGHTRLRILDLMYNQLGSLQTLSSCTGLQELYLSYTGVSDISALSGLTGLTTLYLNNNKISDLSALSGLTGLKTLNLDGNSFTDITPLYSLAGLQQLSLNDVNLSVEQLAALREALPKCTIETNVATIGGAGDGE